MWTSATERAPGGGWRWVTMVAVTLAALLMLTACPLLDDVGRAGRSLRSFADDPDVLTRSKWVPRDLPPVSVPPTADEIMTEANRISAPVDVLSAEERKQLINAGCEVVDYVEGISGTSVDAFNYLFTRSDSAASYRVQAEELVDNLMNAGSDLDRAALMGRAALCEWAGTES